MARVHFRFELKSNTDGVQLQRLASLAGEMQRLLRMIAEDVGTEQLSRNWQAVRFYNGSFGFDLEFSGDADEDQARIYTRAVRHVAAYQPQKKDVEPFGIRKDTILQYAKMGEQIEPTDTINLGFFSNGDRTPDDWLRLSKSTAIALTAHLEQTVEYRGMIQGIVHSLYKESQPPYFDVRELSSQEIVKCIYRPEQYRQVVELLLNRDAVVLVSGRIRARRVDRRIENIHVDKMRATAPLSQAEFDSLVGSAPNLTGDLSTGEFIDNIRRTNENGDE